MKGVVFRQKPLEKANFIVKLAARSGRLVLTNGNHHKNMIANKSFLDVRKCYRKVTEIFLHP